MATAIPALWGARGALAAAIVTAVASVSIHCPNVGWYHTTQVGSTQREDDTRAKQSNTNKDLSALGVDDKSFQNLNSIFEQPAR
jgi:hypothetical protein